MASEKKDQAVGRVAPATRHFLGSGDGAASVAVLVSGGVESAAMLSEAVRRYERVYPIYVRKGFVWETVELAHLKRLLSSYKAEGLAPLDHGLTGLADLAVLELPLRNVYKTHWSLGSTRIPGSRAPDPAVYLPGRNLLLLGLAGLFCGVRRVPALWIGTLKGNPFRDAQPGFLRQVGSLLRESLGLPLKVTAPFRKLTKGQVIRRWHSLPWEKTFSCLNPKPARRRSSGGDHRHCGRCQKCAERRAGFRTAGVKDPTKYAK